MVSPSWPGTGGREFMRQVIEPSRADVAKANGSETDDVRFEDIDSKLTRAKITGEGTRRLEVTFVANLLPYPIDYGGAMATESLIRAIAANASVSLVILSIHKYGDAIVREAQSYYSGICRSFVYHRFPNLSPSCSVLLKAWHYLTGYPRHGFWSREADEMLKQEMKKTGAQVLWCNTTLDAKYLRSAKQMGCVTVLSTQNIESEIVRQQGQQTAESPTWLTSVRSFDMRRLEKFGAHWADVVTAITDIDLAHYGRLKKRGGTFLLPFAYTPNKAVRAEKHPEEANMICFIGSMNWTPNVVAAEYLVRQVMPLVWQRVPDAKCFLVGRNPTESVSALASGNVIVTGSVPSVSEYYERAALIVVPVQDVSGVKIKLIEALAAGKAVVSSSAGKAGLNVEHGKQLMIADNPTDFAAAMIQLLGDQTERARLGTEAERFVLNDLSPQKAERQVEKILQCLPLPKAN
jgi:glycosyltransferase involved in cell wall biosynthesis